LQRNHDVSANDIGTIPAEYEKSLPVHTAAPVAGGVFQAETRGGFRVAQHTGISDADIQQTIFQPGSQLGQNAGNRLLNPVYDGIFDQRLKASSGHL
jgi:hypothetical protein